MTAGPGGEGGAASASIGLDTRQLDRIFPFRIVVDSKLAIVEVGPSIARVWPGMQPGVALPECVSLASPRIAFTFEELADHQRSLVVLRTFAEVRLRGQVVRIDEDRLMFVGSPFVTDPTHLAQTGINLADFALHDATADYMFLLQAQAAALDDARELAARLERIDGERGRPGPAQPAAAHELHAHFDLVVRVDQVGTLLEVRPGGDMELRTPRDELVGGSVYDAFPDMAVSLRDALRHAFVHQTMQTFEHGSASRTSAAVHEVRVVRCSDQEALVLVRDVSDRQVLQRQLVHQGFRDPLTGLANRVLFEERVSHALARLHGTTRRDGGLAVLFIDLDDFSAVNDMLGHRTGDALLMAVSARLQEVTRPGDTVARLDADEFAVLVDGGNQAVAESLAERLVEAFERPFDAGFQRVAITASIGVATRLGDMSAEDLLRNADMAMYAAKTAGKGRPALFEPAMQDGLLAQVVLESELREAVREDQFVVHYQPTVDIAAGRVVGMEALVRWQHPTRGLLLPSEFIPLAEQSGAIVEIGAVVLAEACRRATAWDAGISVSVNVSANQLREPGFVETVVHALELAALDPSRLVLEITEAGLISDAGGAASVLAALKEHGVRLALDDFGTGLSSLSHLLQFPIDVIKIDKSFVDGIAGDRHASVLVGTVLRIGGILGVDVVAEGVESAEQLALLFGWHCLRCQGYLFSRPVPPGGIDELLASPARWSALVEHAARRQSGSAQ